MTSGRFAEYRRWTTSFVIVLGVHVAAGAAVLLARGSEDLLANPPSITIDLAPIAASPEPTPEVAVGPQQVETPPEEEPPPPPEAVAIEPPPKPPEKPKERKKVAKLTTAPTPAEHRAPVAAAPSGASGSSAIPNWRSALVSALERNKRYPSGARGDSGVTQIAFSVDRSGGVHNIRLVRSSGSSMLDSEALALPQRASPLPAPPPEVSGGMIPISVPIRYSVR